MKMQTRTIVKAITDKAGMRTCDVILIIGGSKAETVKYHGRRHTAKVFMFDNPRDLKELKSLCDELQVNQVSLGKGHTTATLSEFATDYYRTVIERVAPMNATSGCGASPLIGHLAAEARIVVSDFSLLLSRLSGNITSITDAAPEMIRLRVLGSYCGGTCAGAAWVIANHFISQLIRFGVPVQVELDLMGPVTFAETSDRVRLTASAVLPFAIAFALDRTDPRQARVTKHLMLGELPPLLDKGVRDQLGLLEEVALNCPQFVDVFEMIRPNQSTASIYGNVTLRETDFYQPLDLQEDIAGEVAATYLRMINDALESVVPDSTLIQSLDFQDRSTPLHPKSIRAIVDSLSEFSLESLLEAIKKPVQRFQYKLFINMTRGHRFDSAKLRSMFAAPATSLSETTTHAKLIATFLERLQDELFEIQSVINGIEAKIDNLTQQFRKVYTIATSRRFTLNKRPKLRQQLEEIALDIRELTTDLANQTAARFEVVKAVADLGTEKAAIDDRVQLVVDMLQTMLPEGSIESPSPLIVVNELDGIFPELVKVTRQQPLRQAEVLRLCAGIVTIEGLAKIVGAPSPRADAIAEAVVRGKPAFVGAPHGGVNQQDDPATVYSFPPVEDYLQHELTKEITALDPRANTVFIHTLAGGANVMRFRFRFPKTIEEIIYGVYPFDLQEALK